MKQINMFRSHITNWFFKNFHSFRCKSENLIYLLKCQIFKNMEKSKTLFKSRLENHRKDIKSKISVLRCKHFNIPSHKFAKHFEFTLTEAIRKQMTAAGTRIFLELQGHLWFLKLKSWYPESLFVNFYTVYLCLKALFWLESQIKPSKPYKDLRWNMSVVQ